MNINELKKKALQLKNDMLEMCANAGTGHVTSSLSCLNIMTVLFYGDIMRFDPTQPDWKGRDRFVMSKGQASPALYTTLADLGYFDKEELKNFAQKNGKFGVHLQQSVPGVEITTGSLGQGFGVAAGMALADKMNRNLNLTFTLIGDGECYEGSMWETAMFASSNKLNNLIGILDRNYLCVTDFTEDLIELEPMEDKWKSFGWNVVRVDGRDFEGMIKILETVRSRRFRKPLMIINDTVKGDGIDSISNIPLWHGKSPGDEEIEICRKELNRGYNNE